MDDNVLSYTASPTIACFVALDEVDRLRTLDSIPVGGKSLTVLQRDHLYEGRFQGHDRNVGLCEVPTVYGVSVGALRTGLRGGKDCVSTGPSIDSLLVGPVIKEGIKPPLVHWSRSNST